MEEEEVSNILIDIIGEFVKDENAKFLEEQKMATSVFWSFALGVINNDEFSNDKIISLTYAIQWLRDNEKLLKGR